MGYERYLKVQEERFRRTPLEPEPIKYSVYRFLIYTTLIGDLVFGGLGIYHGKRVMDLEKELSKRPDQPGLVSQSSVDEKFWKEKKDRLELHRNGFESSGKGTFLFSFPLIFLVPSLFAGAPWLFPEE